MGKPFPRRALYDAHQLSLRTLYSELKQRAQAAGKILPGSPGTLVKRQTGLHLEYWYRSYYPIPKKRIEVLVGRADDALAFQAAQEDIAFAEWTGQQVSILSKLNFQVADKQVAAVLIELHNRGCLSAGLAVVGTLAYMIWLNEYGAVATAVRTQDIDLARRKTLKLAATVPFLSSMKDTQLPFYKVPGLPSHVASTAVKLRGADGLHVDVLAPGATLGKVIALPELDWHAQSIPFYDYLLDDLEEAAMLAGGHCIPVKLPSAPRMLWHKFYSSMHRKADPAKAEKDLLQAATLAAILVEQENVNLRHSLRAAPVALRRAAKARLPRLKILLSEHAQTLDALNEIL